LGQADAWKLSISILRSLKKSISAEKRGRRWIFRDEARHAPPEWKTANVLQGLDAFAKNFFQNQQIDFSLQIN
jgi:hypothetical protein